MGAPAVNWLELQRRLEELTVVAIDVRGLRRAGRRAVIRDANPAFDEMLGVMGLISTFPGSIEFAHCLVVGAWMAPVVCCSDAAASTQ